MFDVNKDVDLKKEIENILPYDFKPNEQHKDWHWWKHENRYIINNDKSADEHTETLLKWFWICIQPDIFESIDSELEFTDKLGSTAGKWLFWGDVWKNDRTLLIFAFEDKHTATLIKTIYG